MIKLFLPRILFDFGLVVLIWMVQLIIYPSFQYYSTADLEIWHPVYTNAISIIVIPLMLGQLIVVSIQIIKIRNRYTLISSVCVLMVWLLTFLIFVPIHNELSNGLIEKSTLKDLVNLNWYRTAIWTSMFLLNFVFSKFKLP